jgi:hypothetical protein
MTPPAFERPALPVRPAIEEQPDMPATPMTPAQLIASVAEPKRGELSRLNTIIQAELPDSHAEVVSGMIGYGKFHYRYPSGREGDTFKVSLASNKSGFSIYVNAVDGRGYLAEQAAGRLGKAKVGKSCIRFGSIDDLDVSVLTEVLRKARATPGAGEAVSAPAPAARRRTAPAAAPRQSPGRASAKKKARASR